MRKGALTSQLAQSDQRALHTHIHTETHTCSVVFKYMAANQEAATMVMLVVKMMRSTVMCLLVCVCVCVHGAEMC